MRRRRNYLFSSGDLGEALRQQIVSIPRLVDEVAGGRLAHQPDSEIAQELFLRLEIKPLELIEANTSMAQSETSVDVAGEFDRDTYGRGPVMVPGVRVVVSIPFVGDPGLWKLRPNSWRTTFPSGDIRAGGADGGYLDITIEQASDRDPALIKQALERQLSDIRFYVESQRAQVASEMAQLPARLASAIGDRRQRLAKHSNLSDLLGIPAAPPANQAPRPIGVVAAGALSIRRTTRGPARDVKWDVFVSHASEDKADFARPLAEALATSGLKVWFDETVMTVGDSLRRSIDRGLANCTYGVVVVSPAFLAKEWPQKELDGLVAREIGGEKVILPVWHRIDYATVAKHSPTLADRLGTNSNKGLEKVVQDLRAAMHAE